MKWTFFQRNSNFLIWFFLNIYIFSSSSLQGICCLFSELSAYIQMGFVLKCHVLSNNRSYWVLENLVKIHWFGHKMEIPIYTNTIVNNLHVAVQTQFFQLQMYASDRVKCISKFDVFLWRLVYVSTLVSASMKEDTEKLSCKSFS